MPDKATMKTGRDCSALISDALKENKYLTSDEIKAVVDQVEGWRNKLKESGAGDINSQLTEAVSKVSQERLLKKFTDEKIALQDIMAARRSAEENDLRVKNSPKAGEFRSLLSRIIAQEGVHNGKLSLENMASNLASDRMTALLSGINAAEKANGIPEGSTMRLWQRGDKEFADAFKKESYGENSGNVMAKELYKIAKAVSDLGAERQTELGVKTDKLEKGFHDSIDRDLVKLHGGANGENYARIANECCDFKEMVDKYQDPLANEEQLQEARARFVRENWLNITQGNLRKPGETGYMEPMTRNRELIFKDAASDIKFHEAFGKQDMASSFHNVLVGDAYRETAFRELTSNPVKHLSEETSRLQAIAREREGGASDSFQLQGVFNKGGLNPHNVMGAAALRFLRMGEEPHVPTVADIAGTQLGGRLLSIAHAISPKLEDYVAHLSFDKMVGYGLAVQAASKLGSALHMTADIGPIIATGLSHGRGAFETMSSIAEMAHADYGKNSEMYLKTANALELWNAEMHRMMPGGAAGGVGRFMELNNKLQGWTAIGGLMRRWVSYLHNTDLAENLHKGFDDAAPRFKNLIQNYGVTESEFRALTDVAKGENGHPTFFTPDMAQYAKGLSQAEKDVLQRKLGSYYTGEAANAMMTHTIRMQMSLQNPFGANWERGSIPYELNRVLMQFWSWGLWAWKNPTNRLLGEGGITGTERAADIAKMATIGTLLGYSTLSLKAMAVGKQPLSLDKEHAWTTFSHSAAYGGVTGPVGDLIFDRWQRHTQGGLVEKAAGPITSEVANIMAMGKKNYWTLSNAEREVMNNAPFVNLHMFKLGLQMMGRWQLEEMLNPGHAKKLEEYAEKDGSPYFSWAKPTKFIR